MKRYIAFSRLIAKDFKNAFQQRVQCKDIRPQSELASIGARHFQNIVQQAEQRVARLARSAQGTALTWRQIAGIQHHQSVEQRVQRRAYLMANNGHEAGFVRNRGFRDLACAFHRSFGQFARGDIGIKRNKAALRQRATAHLQGPAVRTGAFD